MDRGVRPGKALRFGVFEVDLREGELRRHGARCRLQEQPFQLLTTLLERPGEILTREELRARLWPGSIHVNFSHSLGAAINKIRGALGDSATHPRFVETVPRRGYRFIAPIQPVEPAAAARRKPRDRFDSLAVLPFVSVGGTPEIEYLADGIAEGIINRLSQVREIRVMARSSVFQYKGREVDPRAAGRELNVEAMLLGRVQGLRGALTVGAELVEVANGWQLWGDQYHLAPGDLVSVGARISREIAGKLHLRLSGEEERRLLRTHTANADAYHDYLEGRHHRNLLTPEGLRRSIACFGEAIRKDPLFALAHAAQADSYVTFGFFGLLPPAEVMPKGRKAAERALEIDDSLGEAHASLAGILKAFDRDWGGAERAYRRAIDLNPSNAAAHRGYADFLSATGRFGEAIREIGMARESDPLSLHISMETAWNHYMAREHDRAVEHSLATLAMREDFRAAHYTLGLACEQIGRHEEAILALRKALDGSAGNPAALAALGHALATAGRASEAEAILSDLSAQSRSAYIPPYMLALVQSGLARHDQALDSLEEAFSGRDVWLVWLRADPRFDALRADPRFSSLIRRLGFPG